MIDGKLWAARIPFWINEPCKESNAILICMGGNRCDKPSLQTLPRFGLLTFHCHMSTAFNHSVKSAELWKKIHKTINTYYAAIINVNPGSKHTHNAITFFWLLRTILSFFTSIKLSYGRFKIIRARMVIYLLTRATSNDICVQNPIYPNMRTYTRTRQYTVLGVTLSLVARINYIWFQKLDK